MTDILVVPKFSSRQTKGKVLVLNPVTPLTAIELVGGSMVELDNDLSSHNAIRWYLTPYGGVHIVRSDGDPKDRLRWRQALDRAEYPGYVIWQGQNVGMDNKLSDGAPMRFGIYSRRPAFNDRGAQDGYNWTFSDVGVYIGKGEQGKLVVASESMTSSGRISLEQRFKHHMDLLPSLRQTAEAARSGFNHECSDVLSEASDDWRLQFLSQLQRYRKNGEAFSRQCRNASWRQALRGVGQPWQLAIAIREALPKFMPEHNQQDPFAAQQLMLKEYAKSAREHSAAQYFDEWFRSFFMYLDE